MQYYCPIFCFPNNVICSYLFYPSIQDPVRDHTLYLSSIFLVSDNLLAFFPLKSFTVVILLKSPGQCGLFPHD